MLHGLASQRRVPTFFGCSDIVLGVTGVLTFFIFFFAKPSTVILFSNVVALGPVIDSIKVGRAFVCRPCTLAGCACLVLRSWDVLLCCGLRTGTSIPSLTDARV